ncbi:FAD-binding oxidoreductase [Albimonas sp. CAU 1670]|uniref:FAD-binding oxidoreductase n=1 Tax=Albimonas sp. CAU 1670 TaxID=3032599 RepID=UPI0023DA7EA9|nr:FAD-binding oxidoreductase [Albimonas sp. CAU 1670]MDF2233654.1 FAD-binding oxidoreductase [Albimonas sp. CAU 1670]
MDDRLYPLPGAAPVPPEVIARLKAAVGPKGFTEDPSALDGHVTAWRDGWKGEVPLVMRPESTAEVAAIVKICAETGTPIVPQSGNTGLTGGGQPHMGRSEIILSLARMNRIREVDPLNDSMTVEAGVVLQTVQEEAARHDRLFPLSLAAEGTCQIGGNLSTNAGGVQVLRYGNARALVLGLEVVTAQGEIWDGLRALRKDNAGYDMKQVFLGSEGTLGIITAATLKLFPMPKDSAVALVAVPSAKAGIELLALMKSAMGETVTAFELMHEICFTLAAQTMGHEDPMPGSEWRVLLQVDGPGPQGKMAEALEAALGEALEQGIATDAILPSSVEQAQKLWRIREDQAEVQQRAGAGIKHDISVPVSRIPEFVEKADAALEAVYPGFRPCTFGHAGDGNLHYNPIRPEDWTDADWKAETHAINRIVHDLVAEMNGSITAEHGVGRLRMHEMARLKDPVEMALMRRLKAAMDPDGLLNPGKLLP